MLQSKQASTAGVPTPHQTKSRSPCSLGLRLPPCASAAARTLPDGTNGGAVRSLRPSAQAAAEGEHLRGCKADQLTANLLRCCPRCICPAQHARRECAACRRRRSAACCGPIRELLHALEPDAKAREPKLSLALLSCRQGAAIDVTALWPRSCHRRWEALLLLHPPPCLGR